MLSEPAVWGCLPSACLLFLLTNGKFFLKACLAIEARRSAGFGAQSHSADAHRSPAMAGQRRRGLRPGEVKLQLLPTQRHRHPLGETLVLCSVPPPLLGRKQDLTGALISSNSVQNLALPVILFEKIRGHSRLENNIFIYDWRCAQNAKGKPFPGSVF